MSPWRKRHNRRDVTDAALACRKRAMNMLARREHSRAELGRKLTVRGHNEDTVEATLDSLEQEGLLADDRFAESFIRTRVAKGQGPVRIRKELEQRGVVARDMLREADVDWVSLACEVRVKRFGRTTPSDYKERSRQARFLEYRGFEQEQIRRALEFAAE